MPDNVDTGKPGRGVPDVAGNADPQTGYQTLVDGSQQVVGGTSAVAPLWAGLVALLNQSLGAPLGFANPRLYALLGTAGFHDITSGSNGAYSAGPGWDACTGLRLARRDRAGVGPGRERRRRRLAPPRSDAGGLATRVRDLRRSPVEARSEVRRDSS